MEKKLDKEIVDEEMVRLGWRPKWHKGVIVYTRDEVPPIAKTSPKRIRGWKERVRARILRERKEPDSGSVNKVDT